MLFSIDSFGEINNLKTNYAIPKKTDIEWSGSHALTSVVDHCLRNWFRSATCHVLHQHRDVCARQIYAENHFEKSKTITP